MTTSVVGALRVNLGLDSAEFDKGTQKVSGGIGALRTQFLALAGVAAALGTALSAAAIKGATEIDRLAKAGRRVETSVGGFRALELAAGEAGVPVDQLADSVQTMDREIAKASKGATMALNTLGIAAEDLAGLEADEKLALIADRVKALGLSTGQATALLQGLGVRQRETVLLLIQGGDALRSARSDVEDYGLALSAVDAGAIETANDRIARLGLIGQYVGQELAQKLVPAFGEFAKAMTDSLRVGGTLRTVIDGLIGNLDRLAAYLGTVITIVGVRFVTALVAARVATLSLAAATAALGAALLRLPFVALVVGISESILFMGRLTNATGNFGTALGLVRDVAVEVFARIKSLVQAAGLWFEALGQDISAAFNNVLGFVNTAQMASDEADSLRQFAESLRDFAMSPLASVSAVREAMKGTGEDTSETTKTVVSFGDALETTGGKAGKAAEDIGTVADEVDVVSDQFDGVRDAAGRFFETIVTGSGSAKDALASLLSDFARMATNSAFNSLFSAATGALFGGAGAPTGLPIPIPHANGTPYAPGGLSLVGERGPELVNLPRGSQVFNARETRGMAGGVNVSYAPTINAPGASAEAVAGIRAAMAADRARLPSIIQDTVKRAQKDRRL